MKHFQYYYQDKNYPYAEIKVWRIKKNKPEFLGVIAIDRRRWAGERLEVVTFLMDNKQLSKTAKRSISYELHEL